MYNREVRGSYSRSLIRNTSMDINSDFYNQCKTIIKPLPGEAFYIYNFEKQRMLYAQGWQDLVGIPDDEVGMVDVVNLTAEDFAEFVDEVNDKALMFLADRADDLCQYCFQIDLKIVHENGQEIPESAKVAVYDTYSNGRLRSISGSFRLNDSLRFGKVMRLSSFGPNKREFEDALDPKLFKTLVITEKEAEALKLAATGSTDKDIASQIGISRHSVDKRFRSIRKRFGCRSRTELLSFAIDNYLI